MEPDRFQHNQKMYIIGLTSLLISMMLFGLGAFILPRVVFGIAYNIPAFIFDWTNLIQVVYGLSEKAAGWIILLVVFLAGFFFSIVTYVVSHRIDSEIYHIEPEPVTEKKPAKEIRETVLLVIKVLIIIAVIFLATKLFLWMIS